MANEELSETEKKTCPLCGRVLKWTNISLNKLEDRRICSSCSMDISKAFPGRFSYKGITIAKAKDYIRHYKQQTSEGTTTQVHTVSASTPKVPKKAQCPKCHGSNIEPIGQKQKSFSVGKAAVGGALFNPAVGLVTGMMGGNSKKIQFYCHDCGNVFKR